MPRTSIKINRFFFDTIAFCYDFCFGNRFYGSPKEVLNNIPIRNNSRILDAGCGTGNLLEMLENMEEKYKLNLELHGIDISEKMLCRARKKLKKTKLSIQQIEEINYPEDYFDYVFNTDALHHYENPEQAMNNIYRILKNRGKIIVSDFDFKKYINKILHISEPGNNKFYTAEEVRDLLENTGFTNITQKQLGIITHMTIGEK